MDRLPPRRTLARVGVALLLVALVTPAAVSGLTYNPTEFEPGTVSQPADGPTVVGIQGFHFEGQGSEKKPARLAGITADGEFDWQFSGDNVDGRWFYDVDPLANGNLLVVSTNPGGTVVFEYDPGSGSAVWTERFDLHDTHDVDLINGDELLIANMRNYNETSGENDDRLLVYNRTRGEFVWEWTFREHGYEPDGGGAYDDDWTHVNDVDKVANGTYLASPRNFDQVILVDRETKEIEMRLGEDGNHSVLHEQHNPDFLVSEDGTPTLLVADSENDRVVEYERRCEGDLDPMEAPPEACSWNLTWELSGGFNWPRDADRLPNGNTLVTDSLNHRVLEVAPNGTIVWESYATWGPYDAERVGARNVSESWTGGSARGPTIADVGASGSYEPTGSANDPPIPTDGEAEGPAAALESAGFEELSRTWAHVVPWAKPVWMTGWDFLGAVLALLVGVGWAGAELVLARDRIRARLVQLTR
jgi:hypothetical protein